MWERRNYRSGSVGRGVAPTLRAHHMAHEWVAGEEEILHQNGFRVRSLFTRRKLQPYRAGAQHHIGFFGVPRYEISEEDLLVLDLRLNYWCLFFLHTLHFND